MEESIRSSEAVLNPRKKALQAFGSCISKPVSAHLPRCASNKAHASSMDSSTGMPRCRALAKVAPQKVPDIPPCPLQCAFLFPFLPDALQARHLAELPIRKLPLYTSTSAPQSQRHSQKVFFPWATLSLRRNTVQLPNRWPVMSIKALGNPRLSW